jgi:hypothetical protein
MPHTIYLFIDRSFFFNIGIGLGQIGLGLVIIVIADKISHRVIREKRFKLIVKLGCKSFIMSEHQGRFLHLFYDVGNSISFSGSRYPEQSLGTWAGSQALDQFFYGLGLVSRRFIVGVKFKRLHGLDG